MQFANYTTKILEDTGDLCRRIVKFIWVSFQFVDRDVKPLLIHPSILKSYPNLHIFSLKITNVYETLKRNTCVSTNPTNPVFFFCADTAIFTEENKKIFIPTDPKVFQKIIQKS